MTGAILLLGAGFLLILAEVLIPSMGILGIGAIACIVGSIAWGFNISSAAGVRLLGTALVGIPGFIAIAVKILPHSPLTRKLMAPGFSFEDGRAVDLRNKDLTGQVGTVASTLRPVGTAHIDGRLIDVTSRGVVIESGTAVRVIEVSANRVLVVPAEDSAGDPSAAMQPRETA